MDLGLAGRTAIVCGASKGLGFACARSFAREGAELVIVARSEGPLRDAAESLRREYGAKVTPVAADVTTEEGRSAILERCARPDVLVNNAGGPPPGDFRHWSRDDWIKAIDANMLSAIFLIRAVVDGMIDRRFGRIVNVTSMAVKAPISILGLSNGARSGLTGFVAGLARETVVHNVTINNLLPGMFLTERLQSTIESWAADERASVEETAERRRQSIPARRFGEPSEFGDLCAYLCGAQSGYITGQNILLDGGAYPGTF
jgi:3-oxoacyl-[acyl-carrier protein] reductase